MDNTGTRLFWLIAIIASLICVPGLAFAGDGL